MSTVGKKVRKDNDYSSPRQGVIIAEKDHGVVIVEWSDADLSREYLSNLEVLDPAKEKELEVAFAEIKDNLLKAAKLVEDAKQLADKHKITLWREFKYGTSTGQRELFIALDKCGWQTSTMYSDC